MQCFPAPTRDRQHCRLPAAGLMHALSRLLLMISPMFGVVMSGEKPTGLFLLDCLSHGVHGDPSKVHIEGSVRVLVPALHVIF